jgi:hypothetical protein
LGRESGRRVKTKVPVVESRSMTTENNRAALKHERRCPSAVMSFEVFWSIDAADFAHRRDPFTRSRESL